MRKICLLLISFLIFIFTTNASHVLGGEISWECLGSGKYVFKAVKYRDCTGIGVNFEAETLDVSGNPLPRDEFNNVITSIVLQPDSTSWNRTNQGNLSPECNGNPLDCASMDQGAVQAFYYKSDPISLIGTPPANGWTFNFVQACCRPSDIANINSSGTALLRAIMYSLPGALSADPCSDSSPIFNDLPSSTICRGLEFTYNNTAIDYDIDSLVYSFDRPYNTPITNPNPLTYKVGFSPTNPTPDQNANANNIPATLDPLSGIMKMAVFSGFGTKKYIIVFRVDAYREGQRIASVFRELPFSVFDCQPLNDTNGNTAGPNNAPQIFMDGIAQKSIEKTVIAGQKVNIPIQVIDNDLVGANGNQLQELSLTADGLLFTSTRGPYSSPNDRLCVVQNRAVEPCAYLINLTPTIDINATPPVYNIKRQSTINTMFEWEPNCKHLQTKTGFPGTNEAIHNFVMRVQDDHCPIPAINYPTITVKVKDPLPLEEPIMKGISIGLDGLATFSWVPFMDSVNTHSNYEVRQSRPTGGALPLVYSLIDNNVTRYKQSKTTDKIVVYDYNDVFDPNSGSNLLAKAGERIGVNYDWYAQMRGISGCSNSTSIYSEDVRVIELQTAPAGTGNSLRSKIRLDWNRPKPLTAKTYSYFRKDSPTHFYIYANDSISNGGVADSTNWYFVGDTSATTFFASGGNCSDYTAFRVEARDTVITYEQGSTIQEGKYDTLYFSTFSVIDSILVTGGTPRVLNRNNSFLQSSIERSTYQWIDCSTNQPIAGETNRDFTPQTPGFYKVVASNPNCSDTSACFEATPISNDTIVSLGVEFLALSTAGYNWEWTACSGSSILSSGTNRFAPNQFGSYKVLTKKFGYSKLSACFEVLPFTVSAINRSNDSLVSVESAVSYQWFKGCASLPVEVSGATKKQFVPKFPGDYFVRATRFNIDVTSNCVNAQELNDSILILNNSTLKSADTTADYEWMECRNIPLVNNNSQVFNATDTGIYAVKVSAYGYSKTSECVALFAVGLEEESLQKQLSVYPNPTNGELTIQFDHNQSELNVEVYSIQGKLVGSKNYINQGQINLVLNQPSGIYFIQLKNERGERANFKVVKQ